MRRITLVYSGPKHTRFKDYLTDALKLMLFLYLPFLFRLVDTEGYEAEL